MLHLLEAPLPSGVSASALPQSQSCGDPAQGRSALPVLGSEERVGWEPFDFFSHNIAPLRWHLLLWHAQHPYISLFFLSPLPLALSLVFLCMVSVFSPEVRTGQVPCLQSLFLLCLCCLSCLPRPFAPFCLERVRGSGREVLCHGRLYLQAPLIPSCPGS